MQRGVQSLRGFMVPVLLFTAAVAVYLPIVNGQFVWDDFVSIPFNPLLRDRAGLWRIWSTIGTIQSEEHYWPLTYTVLWLGWQSWGAWTPGYHLVNFALHGLVVVQIWRLMRRVGLPGAWLGALLFAVHPVHVEAVAWIISIKDLLATLFYLAAIECWLNHDERGGWKWLALAAVAAAAAMLSKSSPVLLPAGVAILIYYRHGRFRGKDLAALAVLAATTLTFAMIDAWVGQQLGVGHSLVAPRLLSRLVQAGMAFGFYLGKLAWPAGLSAIYMQFDCQPMNAAHWLPLAVTVLVSVILWLTRRRIGRGPLACWLFYGVTLGPALGIIYFSFLAKSPVADRYQYLASVGPIVGIAALVGGWISRGDTRSRLLRSAPAIAVLIALCAVTLRQEEYYRNQYTLFRHAVDIAPESSLAYYNLGTWAWNHKQFAAAEQLFANANQFDPKDGDTIYNLGRAIARQGNIPEAVKFYRDAIAGGCLYQDVWSSLAWLLAVSPDPQVRDPKQALRLVSECLSRSKTPDAAVWNTLAAAQAANGEAPKAAASARRALQLAKEANASEAIQKIERLIAIYDQGKPYVAPPGTDGGL